MRCGSQLIAFNQEVRTTSEDCCPSDDGPESTNSLVCPECESEVRSVQYETLYHHLEPFVARRVNPDQAYGVCRERSCPALYFSANHSQAFGKSDARTRVGFKQSEDKSSHPVCYCFGYTEENITEEIRETGDSTVIDWITERVQAGECACEYKNPTGRCCLGNVRQTVRSSLESIS